MSEPHLHRRVPDLPPKRPVLTPVTLTKVTFNRGEGCCEEDPVREVTTYYDASGEPLFEDDPTSGRWSPE
jgi:hypothetical protein